VSRAERNRLFWIGAATLLVVAALIAIAAVVGGRFDEIDAKILGGLGTVLLAGSVLMLGATLQEMDGAHALGLAVVVVAPIFGVVCIAAIVDEFDSDRLANLAGLSYTLLGGLLIAGSARVRIRDRERLMPYFWLLSLFLAVSAGLIANGIFTEDGDAVHWRLLGTTLILSVLVYLLLPVVGRMSETPVTGAPRRVDLASGTRVRGVGVRLAEGTATLARESVVLSLAAGSAAGSTGLEPGDAVVAPAGTTVTGTVLVVGD